MATGSSASIECKDETVPQEVVYRTLEEVITTAIQNEGGSAKLQVYVPEYKGYAYCYLDTRENSMRYQTREDRDIVNYNLSLEWKIKLSDPLNASPTPPVLISNYVTAGGNAHPKRGESLAYLTAGKPYILRRGFNNTYICQLEVYGSGDKFFLDSDRNNHTKICIYTHIDSTKYYLQLTPEGKNRKNPIVGLSDKPEIQYNFVFPVK